MTLVPRWGYYQASPHETITECKDCGNRYSNERGWCSCGGDLLVVQSGTSAGRSLRSASYMIDPPKPSPAVVVRIARTEIEIPADFIRRTSIEVIGGLLQERIYQIGFLRVHERDQRRIFRQAMVEIKKVKAEG